MTDVQYLGGVDGQEAVLSDSPFAEARRSPKRRTSNIE